METIKVGNGIIKINDKIMNIIENKILFIKIILEEGPCKDDLCPLIKKIAYEINDKYKFSETYKISGSVKIELIKEVYDSINKGREKIYIKNGFKNKIEIKGFSLLSTF